MGWLDMLLINQHLILPELRLLCEKFPFQTKEVIEYCQVVQLLIR